MKRLTLVHAGCSSQWLRGVRKQGLHPRPAAQRSWRVSEMASSSFIQAASSRKDGGQTLHDKESLGCIARVELAVEFEAAWVERKLSNCIYDSFKGHRCTSRDPTNDSALPCAASHWC